MSFEPRQFNADRICEAISKIGYKFHAAIEDIIDNSVAADAKNIRIVFDLQDGATLREKNKIVSITIIDDGIGMSVDGINTALDLGSDVTYNSGSLSKYGLGLKSAGFSLGRKISVYSKKDNILSSVKVLDRDVIKERNIYGVISEEISENLLNGVDSGTVVKISKINIPHDSLGKTLNTLKSRLGVIYSELIISKNISIEIYVGAQVSKIQPKDILFFDLALSDFDIENYDAKSPYLVLDRNIELDDAQNVTSINVKAVIFPMASMEYYPGFSDEEKSLIADYDITRPNSGFYIFRNNRLIKWGDNLGFLNRDAINLRAYISFNTEHDDVLHVDVSKQNLVLTEQFVEALDKALKRPVKQAEEARKFCSNLLKLNLNDEGEKANATLQNVAEEDPDAFSIVVNPEEKRKRRTAKIERSVQEELSVNEQEPEVESEHSFLDQPSCEEVFKKIRYSDKLRHELYKSGFDQVNGAYVKINKNHAFYDVFLSSLPAADKSRIAIEALFWALATAEAITEETVIDVNHEDIIKVFNKFKRTTSLNLENWVGANQEIVE